MYSASALCWIATLWFLGQDRCKARNSTSACVFGVAVGQDTLSTEGNATMNATGMHTRMDSA